MSPRRLWRRYGVYLAPLACATAALLALLWAQGLAGRTSGETGADEDAVELSDAATEAVSEVMELFESEEAAHASSSAAFLDDLEQLAQEAVSQQTAEPVAVTWEEQADLVELASAVVEAYAETAGASLATSGYLDLQGNVWGAVVRGDSSWVDVVLISTSDDETSTASIVRLLPESYGGDE